MRLTLYEPGEATNPTRGRTLTPPEGYAGSVKPGDELYFPHVESCCAVMVFGDNVLVGGHMGQFWTEATMEGNGRRVWQLVALEHKRLNSPGGALLMIGDGAWFPNVSASIIAALKPTSCKLFDLSLYATGVNVRAAMAKSPREVVIEVEDHKTRKKLVPALQVPAAKDEACHTLPASAG